MGEDFRFLSTLRLQPSTALPVEHQAPSGCPANPMALVPGAQTVLPTINKDRDERLCEPGFLSSATKCSRLHGTTPQTSAKYLSNKQYASTEQEHCYKQTSRGQDHACLLSDTAGS